MTERDDKVDFADLIRELVEPRRPETRYEVSAPNKRGHWKRMGRLHRADLPSLLDSLAEAIEPAGDGDVLMAGSFESQPSADMGAIAAEAKIRSEALSWARAFKIKTPGTLSELLSVLVSAPATSSQRRAMTNEAQGWVRQARLATGFDAPFTPDVACPYCLKKHQLIADLDKDAKRTVHCRNCKMDWDESTIGLLAQMLEANQTQTTLTDTSPCPVSPGCYRRGSHDEHWNSRGNTWKTPDEYEPIDERYGVFPAAGDETMTA